jgi:serine-protein kinase ATM
MQALPTSDGYCGPILVNYLKALRTLLEYPPHVEHLREYKKDSNHEFQEWSELVEFCAEGVTFFTGEGDSDGVTTQLSTSRSLLRTPTTSAEFSTKSTPRESSSRNSRSSNSSVQLEEFIGCLRHLTRATNAPITKRAKFILNVVFQFLHSAKSVSRAHHDALSVINSILMRIAPQSIELTQYAVRQIVPLIKDMWQSKSATYRDEMLVTLIITREHILHMLHSQNPVTSDFQTDIEALLEVFTLDYCRRQERDLLSLDDLRLVWQSEQDAKVTPHSHVAFRLQNGHIKGEANWTLVELMALYASTLDTERTKPAEPRSTKRTRKANYFDEFLKQAAHSTGPTRLGAIQILTFMAQFTALDTASVDKILDRLSVLISQDKGEISSWAMLAIAR